MSLVHKNIIIKGRVQGVFFRATAQQMAEQFNIKGLVKNEADSSVSAEAEGEDGSVASFIEWCRKGPPSARVTGVEVSDGELKGYTHFGIVQ